MAGFSDQSISRLKSSCLSGYGSHLGPGDFFQSHCCQNSFSCDYRTVDPFFCYLFFRVHSLLLEVSCSSLPWEPIGSSQYGYLFSCRPVGECLSDFLFCEQPDRTYAFQGLTSLSQVHIALSQYMTYSQGGCLIIFTDFIRTRSGGVYIKVGVILEFCLPCHITLENNCGIG